MARLAESVQRLHRIGSGVRRIIAEPGIGRRFHHDTPALVKRRTIGLVLALALGAGAAGDGCAVKKIHVPGCSIPVSWPDGCDARSYQRAFDDRVEFHCFKEQFDTQQMGNTVEKTKVTQEQVLTYHCLHVKLKGDE